PARGAQHLMLDDGIRDRVVAILSQSGKGRAGIDRQRRAPVLAVLERREVEHHPGFSKIPSQTQGAAIDLALGAILPAVGTVVGAVRSQVEAVPDRAPESERAAAAREGAEAGREVAATFLGRAAEDLDHAR